MSYSRTFDMSGSDSLAKLARWVRSGTTVLELGSASGYFTEFLASRAQAVDIVEIDADAAAQASRYARRTVVADLDDDRWADQLDGVRYDTIVCADVLEHLRDGARLLARLRDLLAPGGELLLSVPNVAHDAIIANLVDDRFEYGGEGLLDPTHVRLYTWRSLASALREAGFGIREWDATTLPAFETEFRVRIESLLPAFRNALGKRPRGRVYQWLVRASPDAPDEQPEPPAIDTGEHVPVRLLYANEPDALSLDRAVIARLPIGGGPVELEWQIPAPASALRLLLADRAGLIRIGACRLQHGNELLWSLDDGDASARRAPSVVRVDAHTFAVTAPDGWLEPAVAPEIMQRADRLRATLAWPSDLAEPGEFMVFAALAKAHAEQVEATARMRDELVGVAMDHDRKHADEIAAHAQTRASLNHVQAALARRNADVAQLEETAAAYRAENARLDAAVTTQERIIGYRQSLRWWLRLPFVRVKLWWHRLTQA
jgi:O-antigen biosynthesis protein